MRGGEWGAKASFTGSQPMPSASIVVQTNISLVRVEVF